jgi:hypothetical protein
MRKLCVFWQKGGALQGIFRLRIPPFVRQAAGAEGGPRLWLRRDRADAARRAQAARAGE